MELLLSEALGTHKMSLASFFELEPREVVLVIEKSNKELELSHRLEYIAARNAYGSLMSKNYKYIDIFSNANNDKKEVSCEEKQKLKDYFESW